MTNNETTMRESSGTGRTGIRGNILTFKADPFVVGAKECYDYISDGLIVMSDGVIEAVGNFATLSESYRGLEIIDRYDDSKLILPGFIDCHTHYVQSPMIASFGDTLLDWLRQYTFPTEALFADKDFAAATAKVFFRQILSQGTTTANVFSTTFATSVDAFFEESERYNTRMITGKVLQDRNLPDNLRDRSARESVELSEELLMKWHGRGRQLYAVIPRFAPTSTPEQLKLAGELYQKHIGEGVYLHSHLNESEAEIRWVKELFPDAVDYTAVYERYGLMDKRTIMAHCCVMDSREWTVLHNRECGIAHCPSSNLFLGDGRFSIPDSQREGRRCRVGIGTDIGAGTNFSVIRQLGDAYKCGMINNYGLDALRGFYLATLGGAKALHLDDCIGALRPGNEADIAVIDFNAGEFTQWRMRFANSLADKLFVMLTLAPGNMVNATYVAGKKVFGR